MKTFIVISCALLVAVTAYTEEQKKKIEEVKKFCVKETGVDEKVIEEAIKTKTFPDDPKLKEFSYCYGKKVGLQNEKGELQVETIKEKLSTQITKEELDTIIEKCVINKETPQETAFHTFGCIRKNVAETVVLI